MDDISVLILDDDLGNRELLEFFLSENNDIRIIGSVGTIDKAVKLIELHKPDVLLLDINLSEQGQVFSLFERIFEYSYFVIYVTAYTDFALSAIKFKAFDYLLKPICKDELNESLNKVRDKIEFKSLPERKLSNGIIAIPSQSRIDFVNECDIVYLKSSGKYTEVCLADRKLISSRHIGEYELYISSIKFVRVHHSFIVNLEHVDYVDKSNGWGCLMTNGSHIPVARRRRDEVSILLGLK